VYEETVIDVIICLVVHYILNPWSNLLCCWHWAEFSGHSIGSGVTWILKPKDGVVQRKRVTRFKKCGS